MIILSMTRLQACEVEWVGNPVAEQSLKKYYEAVKVNDEQVCVLN